MCFHIYFIFPHNFSDETETGKLICELLGNLMLSNFSILKKETVKTSAFIAASGIFHLQETQIGTINISGGPFTSTWISTYWKISL